MRHLKIEFAADGFVMLVLDNADASMNIVNDDFIVEMEEATAAIASDEKIKGVIVTSAKKAFMAGADLHQLVQGFGRLTRQEAYAFSQRATRMHRAMEQSGKPWVAAINGLALGGGFELALACHYRVLVDDPRAQVGLPEVNVGLLPGSGGTVRLGLIAGVKTALDLLLSGRAVAPAEALKLKIVDELAPADQLIERARAWLATGPSPVKPWDVKGWVPPHKKGLTIPEDSALFMMATGSIAQKGYNLPAPRAILASVFEGLQLPFDKALSVEGKYFARLLTDPVARNIIRTSFISKQAAEKGARRPQDVPKSEVKKLGVLGAGMMGAGIAYSSANAGIEVVLIDRDVATAEKGKAYSAKVAGKLLEKGKTSQDRFDALLGRITATDDFAKLEGCDLIVEAVFEDTAIKAETTRKAEAVIPTTAIFASNTSTLPIGQLARASQRPDQFIGIHFFSPVDRMGLVEVIMGAQTSKATLARALDFIAQLRKTPIVVNDSRGFYTSRVFQMLINEGAAMLGEGVPPAVIENAAKAVGMPVGPLALLDEVTVDLPLAIVDQAIAEEGEAYTPPAGTAVMRRMKDEIGRSSRKTGGGFYDYPEGGKKHLWKGLAEHFPLSHDYDIEDLKRRFLYAQAMETARCIEEGVLETPQDADLGAVYGWGFPLWTGGTISYIDTIGIETFVAHADRLAQMCGPRFLPSAWLRQMAARGESFYADTQGSAGPGEGRGMKRITFEPEHVQFRDSVVRFMQAEVGPNAERWREQGMVDREIYLKAGAQGLLCTWADEKYGGAGIEDFRFEQIIIEENMRHGDIGFYINLHNDLVAPYIAKLGIEEQQDRWMPGIVSGEKILAVAMTEPSTGSDLAGIKTRAEDKGDHWLLNGAKTYISNGILADLVIVAARTDPNSRHGLGLLVVERGMEGFERGRRLAKMGLKAQDTAELFFNDVKVPKDNVLGAPNDGFKYLARFLAQERLVAAIGFLATAQTAFDITLDFVKERRAFGKPIGAFQNTRFKMATMRAELDMAQTYVDQCVLLLNAGELTAEDASAAKLLTSEMEGRVMDECVQFHGGAGYMEEYRISRMYTDARISRIFAGTSEIMREIIGRGLGLDERKL